MIFIFDFVTCTKLTYPFIADGPSDDTVGSDFGTNAVNGDANDNRNQLLGNLMKTSKNVLACKYTTLSTLPAVRKGCIRRLKMFNFY